MLLSCYTRFFKKTLLISILFVLTNSIASAAAPWVQSLAPSGSANKVTIDNSGMPIVAAIADGKYVVFKRNALFGSEIWQTTIGGENSIGYPGNLAVDTNNDVIVVGAIENANISHAMVAKIDGQNGNILWSWISPFPHDFEQKGYSRFRSLAIDSENNIYAVGSKPIHNPNSLDFFVVKINGANGQLIWSFQTDGPDDNESFVHFQDNASHIILDEQDNPIVFGMLRHDVYSHDAVVIKLSSNSGTETWRYTYDHSGTDISRDIALLPNGDIVMASTGYNDASSIVRITPGNPQPNWVHTESNAPPYDDLFLWINDIDILPNGDIFFGGSSDGGTKISMIVGRLNGNTGSILWRQLISDGTVKQDSANSILSDSTGDLYVGGTRFFQNQSRMSMARLKSSTGQILWETFLPIKEDSIHFHNRTDSIALHESVLFAAGQLKLYKNSQLAPTLVALNINDGKPPIIVDEFLIPFLIPIWEDKRLWLVPVENIEASYKARLQLLKENPDPNMVVTREINVVRRHPNAKIMFFPKQAKKTLQTLDKNPDAFKLQGNKIILFVEKDSSAHEYAFKIMQKHKKQRALK